MKKVIFAFVVAATLVACEAGTKKTEATPVDTTAAVVDSTAVAVDSAKVEAPAETK